MDVPFRIIKSMPDRTRGAAFGLAAAVLFGASAPLARLLLASAEPLMLAALLYLGAGAGLSFYRLVFERAVGRHAPVTRADLALNPGSHGPRMRHYGA